MPPFKAADREMMLFAQAKNKKGLIGIFF